MLPKLDDETYGHVSGDRRGLVREASGASGSTEIDTQGDAYFFSVPRAREAVSAAVDTERAKSRRPRALCSATSSPTASQRE